MKKTYSFFLVLLLVIVMLPLYAGAESAVEEPFTMRGGIQFGDTKEVVREKLGDEGISLVEEIGTKGTVYAGIEYLATPEGKELEIAGIEGVRPFYYFDNNGQLYEVRFQIFDWYDGDITNINTSVVEYANYYKWRTSLPEGLRDNTEYYNLIENLAQKYGMPTESGAEKNRSGNSQTLYSEWLIPQSNEGIVSIKVEYSPDIITSEDVFANVFYLEWRYSYIEPEIIQEAIDEKMEILDDL